MNKFIIKNCPCYQTGVNELNENCFHYGKCQDKTDCVIKQITKRLIKYQVNNILNLLETKECEG